MFLLKIFLYSENKKNAERNTQKSNDESNLSHGAF